MPSRDLQNVNRIVARHWATADEGGVVRWSSRNESSDAIKRRAWAEISGQLGPIAMEAMLTQAEWPYHKLDAWRGSRTGQALQCQRALQCQQAGEVDPGLRQSLKPRRMGVS
jgi:hypothetical protein